MLYLFLTAVLLAASPMTSTPPPSTASRRVYLYHSNQGVHAVSPDGKFAVSITKVKLTKLKGAATKGGVPEGPFITLHELGTKKSVQVQPFVIVSGAAVLWQPGSRAFALTRLYPNATVLNVVQIQLAQNGSQLRVHQVKLTPLLQKTLDKRVRDYYRKRYGIGKSDFESLHFYAKSLHWLGNDRLLVGVFSTSQSWQPPYKPGQRPAGLRSWCFGYVVDVAHLKILRTLNKNGIQGRYGFKCLPQD